ncbi:hypothetical protein [Sinisalibacter aestuarii]|uniref:Uncharacterized protein n=1 Tax=Sinisalibacter aestuarii TaxID=2949426 RepID=A0ABQ5LXN0_9RHOB|nr:hypothetical protein [Sinisalibacter aestuarii]GKY89548.1 hypothetical protein STA1M1_34170 [Sinisalibacter aestuarii]
MSRAGGIRRSTLVFALIGAGVAALAGEALHARLSRGAETARMAASATLVRRAGLTDLALFTEARYTRHPALADLHTPFQDNPMAFEHFPSGTFAPRPESFGSGRLGFSPEEVAQ